MMAVRVYFVFCVIIVGLATYANFKGYYWVEQVLSRVSVERE